MPDNAAKVRPGWMFWLAVIWLAIIIAAAATVERWSVPAFDAMDWDHAAAAPGTRSNSATLQTGWEPIPWGATWPPV